MPERPLHSSELFERDVHQLFSRSKNTPYSLQIGHTAIEFPFQARPPQAVCFHWVEPIKLIKPQYSVIATLGNNTNDCMPTAALTFRRAEDTRKQHRESAVVYYSTATPLRLGRLSLRFGSFEAVDTRGDDNPIGRQQSEFHSKLYHTLVAGHTPNDQVVGFMEFETQIESSEVTDMRELRILREIVHQLGPSV